MNRGSDAAASVTPSSARSQRQMGRLWGLTSALTDRRAHRSDRRQLHRAAARRHAARGEPVRPARYPQRAGPAAADDGRSRTSTTCSARSPSSTRAAPTRWPPSTARCRWPCTTGWRADPGAAARRRAARDDGDRSRARSSCRRATCRCGCRSRSTSPSASRSTSALRTPDGCRWVSRCGCRCIPTPTARCCSRSR